MGDVAYFLTRNRCKGAALFYIIFLVDFAHTLKVVYHISECDVQPEEGDVER